MVQNTGDKEGRVCATCKKHKPYNRYYKRENKKPERYIAKIVETRNEKKDTDIGNKSLSISYQHT